MRFLQLFSICIFILFNGNSYAQNPTCKTIVNQVQLDSIIAKWKLLVGRDSVKTPSGNYIIKSRYINHPGNNLAQNYLTSQLTEYGYIIQNHTFSVTGTNVIAYKKGFLNDKTAYVLSAHFDSMGNNSSNFQGADDNASGVAAVLEAARLLKDYSFPFTLVLALWDEEEQGLIGSKAFAPSGPSGYWDINLAMNMDMLAYDGNQDKKVLIHASNIGASITYAQQIVSYNDSFQTNLLTVVKTPGSPDSDHQSFWNMGTTAVGLTEDYDSDLNPNWHLFSDSIENCHLPYFYQLTRLAIGSFCEFAMKPKLVGITEYEPNNSDLYCYPNPSSEWIYLNKPITKIRITDIKGSNIIVPSTSNNTSFDISHLDHGIYFITGYINDLPINLKFIKQ